MLIHDHGIVDLTLKNLGILPLAPWRRIAATAMENITPSYSPRIVAHLSSERIEVHGGWLSFLAVGEQTGGAYALIETANDPFTGVEHSPLCV